MNSVFLSTCAFCRCLRLFLVTALLGLAGFGFLANSAHAAATNSSAWLATISPDGSMPTARHEAAAVSVGDYLYLIGGRGNRPVERYSPSTGHWETLGLAPIELHHVQPVVIGTDIYVLGAFTCCYPSELSVAEIYVFDTQQLTWDVVGEIPTDRLRGSAAAVVHDQRIYLIGGNTQGHDGGAVPWFDEYDPFSAQWRVLPDAPHARDHFSAVVIGQSLIAAAGRQSMLPNPSANAVSSTDIYDFESGLWRSAAAIPTVRGGAVAVAHGNQLIVAGGEINTASAALDTVEAYDLDEDAWLGLPSLLIGRHGSGGAILDNQFHMVSGASSLGGAVETATHERLVLPELATTQESASRRGSGSTGWPLTLTLLGVGLIPRISQRWARRLRLSNVLPLTHT